MQKSKVSTIFFIVLIFVYILASQFCLSNLGSIYTFIINPLFFISVALFLKIFLTPPYITNKYKKEIIQYVLITILFYSLIYLLSGLLTGFGTNPYSSSVRGLIINFFATGLIVLCREYIRYKLINNVYNKDKKLIFVFLVIVFSLINFNIIDLKSSLNVYYLFKQIFYILVPNIFKNILFTYIVMYTDFTVSFLYDIIYYLMLWIAPVLPQSPWVLESILDSIFPLILFLYCRYYIHKKDRFHLNSISQPINPSGIIPFGIALVITIWFALGIFPVKPVGIATGSMAPELNVGDLAIIQKCTANDISTQDIIEYQLEDYTVVHRVISIYQENGEFIFITKGDNNTSEDNNPVREDQLIGKVLFKIRYVARPTVWIHNLNAKTQLDVETGI